MTRAIGTAIWLWIIGGTSLLAVFLAHLIYTTTVAGIYNARACGTDPEVCVYSGHGR